MRGTGCDDGYICARACAADAAKMSNANGSQDRLTILRPGKFRVLPSPGSRRLLRFASPTHAAAFGNRSEQSRRSRRLQGAVEHRFERTRAGKPIGRAQRANG